MVVNSINFWFFFVIVLLPYFILPHKGSRWQNLWLLAASYFFYGWADWEMVPLLIAVTLIFFLLGKAIGRNNQTNPKTASRLTTLGVVLGIALLVYFKYLGFLVEEFAALFSSFGLHVNASTFNIIMPIGISFFTFKLISYAIEIHRENIEPTNDFILFATYIAFFPTILSGPIDKPNTFLSQLERRRTFCDTEVSEGLKRVIWGMFLKMCIADRLSPWTDAVLNNYSHHNGTSIILAGLLYMIQLYADFAGYSEMAIGVARVMGLKVTENFKRPFFAQNVSEYWRGWHISLTSWITNYVFMPLNVAFRDWGKWGLYLATLINLVVIGAWHGANWTYVLFGVYHGTLLIIVMAVEKKRKKYEKQYTLKKKEWYKWSRRFLTFLLCSIGAVLFRAASVPDFLATLARITDGFGPIYREGFIQVATMGLLSVLIMFFKEYKDEYKKDIHFLHSEKIAVNIASVVLLVAYIVFMGELNGGQFIYFQF